MIVRDPRASFMCSAVHSPVNDKIDPAVLIDSEDLDAMLRHIVPDIIGRCSAEREHPRPHVLTAVVSPQFPVCHKCRILATCALYGVNSVTVSDPQKDPLSGEQFRVSGEKFRHRALVIHHVDPLG